MLDELMNTIPNMEYSGEDENGFEFYGTYEDDFSFEFHISKTGRGFKVLIYLYTNTRFPVREFRVNVNDIDGISKLYETVFNKCKKMSKEMDGLVE